MNAYPTDVDRVVGWLDVLGMFAGFVCGLVLALLWEWAPGGRR